jgi:hypothetical protein
MRTENLAQEQIKFVKCLLPFSSEPLSSRFLLGNVRINKARKLLLYLSCYWISGLCPSSGILKDHNVSEIGSVPPEDGNGPDDGQSSEIQLLIAIYHRQDLLELI